MVFGCLRKQRFNFAVVFVLEILRVCMLYDKIKYDREWSGDDLSSLAQMLKSGIAVITLIHPKVEFLFSTIAVKKANAMMWLRPKQ